MKLNASGKLKYRMALPVTGVVALLLVMSVVCGYFQQKAQAEDALHEQAYVLSQEMSAVWDFISANQYRINTDADGTHHFKGLHCSIAATSVAALFSNRTDYVIRYVSDTPRNALNASDEMETEALAAFRNDSLLNEYTGYTTKQGTDYYRYVIPLRMEDGCAPCHGSPAGELDETGFPREGLEIGDVVGAASISIPIEMHQAALSERIIAQAAFLALAFAACLLAVYATVTHYVVRPLEKIEPYVRDVGQGKLAARIDADEVNARNEMQDFVLSFNEAVSELELLKNELDQKVEERTAELQAANEKLAMNDRYKTHYFTMMSHELRTPLASIRANADLLKEGDLDEPGVRGLLGGIVASTTSLSKIVDNILESARLDAGKVELSVQAVDAVDVMGELNKTLAPLATAKDILLYFYVAKRIPMFMADQDKLLHILENLGSNAIKYSHEGGVVVVEAYYHQKDNTIRFAVIDDGVGVPAEEHSIIFEKFLQAERSMAKPVSGSGLGLALAKEYAEMHGGTISVQSAAGEGSIFRVVLPCVEPDFSGEGDARHEEDLDSR